MSARQFSKVSPAVWRSGRFVGLGDDTAQLLYIYFLSCEHQTSAGCFRLPDGYACSDLGWALDKYAKARAKLMKAELITFDPMTSEIFIDRWFKHSPPTNEKHAQGSLRLISAIDSDLVREKAEAEFMEASDLRAPKPEDKSHLLKTAYINGGRRPNP